MAIPEQTPRPVIEYKTFYGNSTIDDYLNDPRRGGFVVRATVNRRDEPDFGFDLVGSLTAEMLGPSKNLLGALKMKGDSQVFDFVIYNPDLVRLQRYSLQEGEIPEVIQKQLHEQGKNVLTTCDMNIYFLEAKQ